MNQPDETWIAVASLLPDGERFAVAWIRRSDEWLADVGRVPREQMIDELARMYERAVARRGRAPDRLNVRASAHADALRERIGPTPPIELGFDDRAQSLSDAAAEAVDVTFGANDLIGALAAAGDALYDPNVAPDPAIWREMPEEERRELIALAHAATCADMDDETARLHAAMHDAVESQIAHADPPETGATVDRLVREGLSRHDAIHAALVVLMEEMGRVVRAGTPFDRARYAAALAELTGDRPLH